MVDRCDSGRILVEVQYDPAITEADLDEAEELILLFIARRRRIRREQEGIVKTAMRSAGVGEGAT